MASYPTYNPQDIFIDGISDEEYAMLTDEENGNRLSNKVISGVYAPGSTFKPVTVARRAPVGLDHPGLHLQRRRRLRGRGVGEDQPSCQSPSERRRDGERDGGSPDLYGVE